MNGSRSQIQLQKELETLLRRLGQTEVGRARVQAEFDGKLGELKARYAGRMDRLSEDSDALMAEIERIITAPDNWEKLQGDDSAKTIVLRSGTISIRKAAPTLVVTDEAKALRSIRRLGVSLRFIKRKTTFTIDKVELKKAPEMIAKIRGVELQQDENLIVRVARGQIELRRVVLPFRVRNIFGNH